MKGFKYLITIFGLLFFGGSSLMYYAALQPVKIECKFAGAAARCTKSEGVFYKKTYNNVATSVLARNYRKGRALYRITFLSPDGKPLSGGRGGNIGVEQMRSAELQLRAKLALKKDFVLQYKNTALARFALVFMAIGLLIFIFGIKLVLAK